MKVYFVEIFGEREIETHVNQTHEGALKRVADYCRREWPKHFMKSLASHGDETVIDVYFEGVGREHYEITEKELGA
jgi:hypothetical protein